MLATLCMNRPQSVLSEHNDNTTSTEIDTTVSIDTTPFLNTDEYNPAFECGVFKSITGEYLPMSNNDTLITSDTVQYNDCMPEYWYNDTL